jgi:hypothetical protein
MLEKESRDRLRSGLETAFERDVRRWRARGKDDATIAIMTKKPLSKIIAIK